MYRKLLLFVVATVFLVHAMHKSIDDLFDAEESYHKGKVSSSNSLDAEESYYHSEGSDYDAEESYHHLNAFRSLQIKSATAKQAMRSAREPVTSRGFISGEEEGYDYHNEEASASSATAKDFSRQNAPVHVDASSRNKHNDLKDSHAADLDDEVDWLKFTPRAQQAAQFDGGVIAVESRIAGEGTKYYSKDDFYGGHGTGLYVSKNLTPIMQTVYHTETKQAPPVIVPAPVVPHYDPPEQRRPDGGYYVSAAK